MASLKGWAYAAILAALVGLSGCAAPKMLVETKTVLVEPPAALFECPPAPMPPTGEYSQADLIPLITDLYSAHATCENSIASIRDYIQKQKAIIAP